MNKGSTYHLERHQAAHHASTTMQEALKVSIIIPVYNGSKTIGPLVEELETELAKQTQLEVVLINDCSPSDNSAEVCRELANTKPWIVFLNLSKNYGEHNAVMAGLAHCSGDVAVIIDDDFQNPPQEIIKLIDEIQKGYDVVFSRYDKKEHHYFRNLGSRLNSWTAQILLQKPKGLYLSSFKAINRFVINELTQYVGPYPYIDGLILQVTQSYSTVTVQHNARQEGESGYTVKKLLALYFNMFTNFSILPLRIASVTGFIFAAIGLILTIVFTIEKFINPNIPMGWASVIVFMSLFAGIQLLALGMIGEYLGRLFMKNNGRKQYTIRETVNLDQPNKRKTPS